VRRNRNEDESEFDLPMTPLIDVIFILIIFFLVGSTFANKEKDIDVKLPNASKSKNQKIIKKDLIINIRQDGIIIVNGNLLTIEMLEDQIIDAVNKNPKQIVQIRADELAYHKYTVRVMDLCQKHNVRTITIAAALNE